MPLSFTIGPPDADRRIERYLQRALGDVPVSLVRRLLRQGKVRRNGQRVKAGVVLAAGDELRVYFHPRDGASAPSPLPPYAGPPLRVLHRDAGVLALAKPAHVSCSEDPDPARSVPAWLAQELRQEIAAGLARPSLCHRLDRGTTGVVLVGLGAAAITAFHEALAEGGVRKLYRVLVWGGPEEPSFDCRLPLRRRQDAGRREPRVVPDPAGGRPAHTRLRRLGRAGDVAWLEAEPVTGRTHQIRAHLHALGWPVLGDPRYGDPERDRREGISASLDHQALHAWRLEWNGPHGPIRATAPLPDELRKLLKERGLVDADEL